MTRELISCLTLKSAKFLVEALGHLDRDMYDRYSQSEFSLDAVRIAIEWQANENEAKANLFLRGKEKREARLAAWDSEFAAILEQMGERRSGGSSVEPLGWSSHFSTPLPNTTTAAPHPDNKKVPEGSLEHCFLWSAHNLDRIAQHGRTLTICETLIRDHGMFKHLAGPLNTASAWVWQRRSELRSIRTQLILLEGDPVKIQALREELADSVRRENVSTDHYYGGLNRQGMGSTSAGNRFRSAVLHHVQAGFEPGSTGAPVDLGLG